jgi:predicted dehydrogenase
MALVKNPRNIKIGMIGCTEGNGHPYSWSAIFNGYNPTIMIRECPFPAIPLYLNKEPMESFGIEGASITHICCQGNGGFSAEQVANASLIPNIVEEPEDMIGKVDAVIIATDIGAEHKDRARPFIEAGIPLFIDKPLVDNEDDLALFIQWAKEGKSFISSSSMRYCKEFLPWQLSTHELGALRFLTATSSKKWETYGIHALESIFPIIGPGFLTAQSIPTKEGTIVHLTHKKRADAIIAVISDMSGGFGSLQICGTEGRVQTASADTFYSFKTQLEAFVKYLRTGKEPFPFEETVELMKLLIAGIKSRKEKGRIVALKEIG